MSASAKAAARCRVELRGKGLPRAENNQPITSELSLCLQRGERQLRADCVEKLVVFDPLMLVTTLIFFGGS
jgi:hypothetical protein